jgi:hypothetical protein
MEKHNFTTACPIARAERPRAVNEQAPVSEDRETREETIGTESESFVAGMIVDS